MSNWFVNGAWTDFYAAGGDPVWFVDCSDVDGLLDIDTTDALSAPSVEALLPAGLAMWPTGAAWGTPDGVAPSTDSVIAKLTRALLDPFATLYARAWRLTEESRAATLVDSLPEWEADYGLPDPCATSYQDEAQRKARLRSKVAGLATITPADFVRFAARLGYVVALEEPAVFRVGQSQLGSCDELTDTDLAQQFVLHIHDVPATYFRVGEDGGQAGVTRLLDFDIGVVECAVRRETPALFTAVFSIAPRPVAAAIEDDDGALLSTETGCIIVWPLAA